jgi:hypothetical protein
MRSSPKLLSIPLLLTILVGALAGCTVPSFGSGSAPTPTVIAVSDVDRARQALTSYFDALFEGRYADAVHLYAGEYKQLTDFNPDVAPEDHAKLLERGCTVNGFQCMRVKTTADVQTTDPEKFVFAVEFQDRDGNPFVLNSQGQFPYTVQKFNETFLVQELPVHIP